MTESRRQELLTFASTGRLRQCVAEKGLSEEAASLLVDITMRYCEPRRESRRTRIARKAGVTP